MYPVKGPLQLYVTIHAVQIKTHVEEQKKHWNMKIKTKTTISNYMRSLFCFVFVFLSQCVPCFNLLSSRVVSVADPGEAPPPPFLNQTEARRHEIKKLRQPSINYLTVWVTAPPPPSLSEGLDRKLGFVPRK